MAIPARRGGPPSRSSTSSCSCRIPANERAYIPSNEVVGFALHLREPGWHQHRLLRADGPNVNLHVFAEGSKEAERMLLFRIASAVHVDAALGVMDTAPPGCEGVRRSSGAFGGALLVGNVGDGMMGDRHTLPFAAGIGETPTDFRHLYEHEPIGAITPVDDDDDGHHGEH